MRLLLCLSAALSVAGASGAAVRAATPELGATAAPDPPRRSGDYILGPRDKLRITVFGEPALSGEFVVSNSGGVAFPLIGEVAAANTSSSELERAIGGRLSGGYLRDPRVSVEVIGFRPFYILGEVAKPGEYPYASGLDVFSAVATAGGFTYRAQTKKVYVRSANDRTERVYPLKGPVPIAPGDTIRVAERRF